MPAALSGPLPDQESDSRPPHPYRTDTVVSVKSWAARVLGVGCTALVGLGGAAAAMALPGPAQVIAHTTKATTAKPHTASQTAPSASADRVQASTSIGAAAATTTGSTPVILIGVSGLRWTDITQAQAPALWRLAEHGSVGSLVVSGVRTYTCPADAWLTVNSGARTTATPKPEPCRLPTVLLQAPSHGPVDRAWLPAMDRVQQGNIESINTPYSYGPCWGVLGNANAASSDSAPRPVVTLAFCAKAIEQVAALPLCVHSVVLYN